MTIKEVNSLLEEYGLGPFTLEEIKSDANLKMWLFMSLDVDEFTC